MTYCVRGSTAGADGGRDTAGRVSLCDARPAEFVASAERSRSFLDTAGPSAAYATRGQALSVRNADPSAASTTDVPG